MVRMVRIKLERTDRIISRRVFMKLQESERTEFKSIVVTDIKKEIIAFANCDGGKSILELKMMGQLSG